MLYFGIFFFVNNTSHNRSTTITEAGKDVFRPTEHSYAKKIKILDLALFIPDGQNYWIANPLFL